MALWFVYVVRCRDDSLYTGITTDVAARVAVHNAGAGARYTRARRPVEVVLVERKRSRSTALRREAFIKSLSRRQKDALVATVEANVLAGIVATSALRSPARRRRPKPRSRSGSSLTSRALALGAAAAAAAMVSGVAPGLVRAAADRVDVPAGPFVAGSNQGADDERPVRDQPMARFLIDRTEVTQAAYLACVGARRCKRVPERFRRPAGADGQLPVTGVSWFDARDYCRFAGGRLPTELEWEKAARGPEGREYPWGAEAACDRANWGNFGGEGPCAGQSPGFPVAVGRYESGVSPYGALDMAGNVWEWVADRYDDEAAFELDARAHPRANRRVVRGGSCCSYFVPPRAANRNAWDASYRDQDLGFRCAANPAPRSAIPR
jgi:formylglycine-generating enzyme required for sulfatase activity